MDFSDSNLTAKFEFDISPTILAIQVNRLTNSENTQKLTFLVEPSIDIKVRNL